MTEKRFKVHSMIQGMEIGETMDLELCEELIKKYGSSSDIDLLIEDNGKYMTYQEVVDLLNENEQLKKENYKLHKRLGDFEQFEEHIKERTSKTFVKECVYFDSVLRVCNIDGSVNCPCENYEELVRWIDD